MGYRADQEVRRSQYFDHPVHHVAGGIGLLSKVVEGDLQSFPLLGSRESAFAEHDQAGMEVDTKQRDEVAGIGGDDAEVVRKGIGPNGRVASAGEADMRHRYA